MHKDTGHDARFDSSRSFFSNSGQTASTAPDKITLSVLEEKKCCQCSSHDTTPRWLRTCEHIIFCWRRAAVRSTKGSNEPHLLYIHSAQFGPARFIVLVQGRAGSEETHRKYNKCSIKEEGGAVQI